MTTLLRRHGPLFGTLIGVICLLSGGCGPGIVTDYPPAIAITYPASGYETSLLSQNIMGTCTVGITVGISLSASLSGPSNTTCSNGYFSFNVTVPAIGGTSFEVTASQTDAHGNTGNSSISFTFSRTAFLTSAGFDGEVNAMVSDSSGNIYLGGSFTNFSGHAAPGLAEINSSGQFQTSFITGTGLTGGTVNAITTAPEADGDLYFGGAFTDFNGSGHNGIVRLTSAGAIETTFLSSGGGVGGAIDSTQATSVTSIAGITDGSDEIYIVGNFTSFNSGAYSGIVRLTNAGATTNTVTPADLVNSFNTGIGTGFSGGIPLVAAYTVDGTDDVLVGGTFTGYQGSPQNQLVRLTTGAVVDTASPVSFSGLAFANTNGPVVIRAILPVSDGSKDFYVGGDFTSYNGTPALGVVRLAQNGSISASTSGTNFNNIIASGFNGGVRSLAFVDSSSPNLLVGGNFSLFGTTATQGVARISVPSTSGNSAALDSSLVSGTGFIGVVNAVLPSPTTTGSFYVGGGFVAYNGSAIDDFASLTSSGGVASSNAIGSAFHSTVYAINPISDGTGDIYAGGAFTHYQGGSARGLLRLQMTGEVNTGFAIGSGFTGSVTATGSTTSSSASMTSLSSVAGIMTGMIVSGANVIPGTTVTAISGSTVTLSIAATGTSTGSYTFSWTQVVDGVVNATGSTATSTTLTVSSTTGIMIGMTVSGEYIPAATTVAAIPSSTTITLSQSATGTSSGTPNFQFYWPNGSGGFTSASVTSSSTSMTSVGSVLGIRPGMAVSGPGIVPGTAVAGVDGVTNTITLSLDAVSTTSGTYQFSWTVPSVFAIAPTSDGTGDFYVGGNFTAYQGNPVGPIVRLTSTGTLSTATNFNYTAAILITGPVYAITPDGSGNIFVGGRFPGLPAGITLLSGSGSAVLAFTTNIGNGVQLGAGGSPPPGAVYAIARDPSGNLYLGGNFTYFDGVSGVGGLIELSNYLGTITSNKFGGGFTGGAVRSLSAPGSSTLYVGGDFTDYQSSPYSNFLMLESGFSPNTSLATGASGRVSAIASSNSIFLLGGNFADYLGVSSPGMVAILPSPSGAIDDSFAVQAGFNGAEINVQTIAPAVDGSTDVYVGGAFNNYQGSRVDGITRLSATGSPD